MRNNPRRGANSNTRRKIAVWVRMMQAPGEASRWKLTIVPTTPDVTAAALLGIGTALFRADDEEGSARMAPTRAVPRLRRADAAKDGSFFPFPLGKNRRNLPKSKGKSEIKTF